MQRPLRHAVVRRVKAPFALAAALGLLLSAAPALAQPADAGLSELETLQAEMDRDNAQAQSADCATACRALEGMRRAADRLCQLDPGDRCTAAREKVRRAAERVRAACPDCAATREEGKEREAEAPRPAPPELASSPAEAHKGGGCAGCSAHAPEGGTAALLAVAGGVFVLAARRRRPRR